MGRGWFRNWWSLGAVIAIVVTAAWLLYLLWRTPNHHDLAIYGALVLPVAAIVAGWLAWAWRKRTAGPAGSENLDRVADQLAAAVRVQWQYAAEERGLTGADPIRITWGRPSLPIAGPVAAAVGSVRFSPLPGLAPIREADLASGQAADLHTVYGGLQSGRLIIAGPPGSGKTGTAVLLVLAALRRRQEVPASDRPQVPVPVLLAAQDWNPARQLVTEWVTRKLEDTYPLFTTATGVATAAALINSGRITVILDGLDEISPDLRSAALQALNQQATFRLVLLSRTDEMAAAAASHGSLQGAAAIELNPVDPADAASYLERTQLDPPPPEWQQLIVCIRTDRASPLSKVLTNPLMLSLVGTIYTAGPFGSSPPIGDLFRLPDETAITNHLLTEFVANAYHPRWRGRNWTATQAEGWLALIGSQMRALSTEGYAWRQTSCAVPTRLLGLLSGTATGLGLLVTFTALGVIHQVFGDRMQLGPAIGALAAASIVPAVVAALLVAGINSGSLLSLLSTIAPRLTLSVPALAGLVTISTSPTESLRKWRSELLYRRQGTRSATSPREDLVQSRRRAFISAAVVGVTLGLAAAAMVLMGVHVRRDATIIFVCYCMAVTVLCASWGSYQLARSWFSVRRELPYRLLGFLEDARDRSILRSAGPQFEFRNNLIREYYSDPARLPEVRQEISALTNWVLGNLEIRESYQHVGADESDIRQAVSSLVTETILTGQRFAADAAIREAALERVRVRLNELGRRSAFEESLVAREAPGLGAAIDPSRVILTSTMDDLARLIDRISSASVGISGIRGIGKSTLIRWLCTERNASRRLPFLGIYVTAPVEYDARDFLIHLYITLCKAVLADDRFTGRRSRQHWSLWRVALGTILVTGGLSLYYHHAVDHEVTVMWAHDHGALWFAAASVLFIGGLSVLISAVSGMWRRRGGKGRRIRIEATARDRLRRLRYQVVETTGQTGKLAGPFGLSFGGSRSRQVTENQMTLPELVESYREFAELTVSTLQESARQDGPLAIAQVRLVVGIDEIDRIEDAEKAEKFLNDIKAIFGVPNCFYIASLSADALANFERRVVSTRTAFDTTFDTVMRIGPLELRTARQVLELRAIGLPYPFITLCYVLSGGVPRELMRIARAVFDARNDVRFGSADAGDQGSVACSVIVSRVITHEMESLRQGLMPMATQLNVPGATELIGLLDDPDWPSGNTRDDMAKLNKITGQRALFQDETSSITAAAKICDGLAAASYFFLSVGELFRARLDQIIGELKRYETVPEQDADPASSINLLAKARAAIGVNPALAITRVRTVREHYQLSEVSPTLVSQLPIDSVDS